MDLSNRVVQVRSTLKLDVKEYPTFTPDDIGLLFGDIVSPTGLILNHNDPTECYEIFSDSEYVSDILKLVENPQWVGTHMHYSLDRPRKEIISIIAKLLEDQPLEDGEDYKYIPIEVDGSPQFATPKKGEDSVIPQLVKNIRSLQTSELKQHMTAISKEIEVRHEPQGSPSKPEASGSQHQEVSSILHSLIKEGTLRSSIPKLSVFSGERLKGEASFEQWSYEIQSLTYRLTVSHPRGRGFRDH